MAHYAFIDENNLVVDVIAGRDENEIPEGVDSWESHYGQIRGLDCKRTSYNTRGNQHANGGVPFRGNYAGIGFTYDETRDAFIPPRPFESWNLSEITLMWEAPFPRPDETYIWNEESQTWEPVEEAS